MAIKGYDFYLDGTKINQTLSPSPTYTFTGLASGTNYDISAKAVDMALNESDLSNVLTCATTQYDPSGEPMSDADKAVVDGIIAAQYSPPNPIGMAISITGPKGYYTKLYGTRLFGFGPNPPVTTDDHWRIGSVSKSFAGLLVLQAVDDGLVDLDAPYSDYVSGVPNGNATIRQIMMHRSGIPDFTGDFLFQLMVSFNPTMNFSHQQAMSKIRSGSPAFAAGSSYAYNNSAGVLMRELVETVRSEPIRTTLNRDILTPLGMTETSLPTGNGIPEPQGGEANQYNPEIPGMSGAMISTIGDLERWAIAMRDGALLSAELGQERRNYLPYWYPYPGLDHPPANWAWGLSLQAMGRWRGHSGSIAGYSAATYFHADNDATISVTVNSATDWASNAQRVLAMRLWPGSMDG